MKVTAAMVMVLCAIVVFAKDKPTFTIEVVGTDTWQRDLAIRHAGTDGTSSTNCNTNGTVNTATYGDYTNGNINASTDCTTTTTPGSPAYTTHHPIQQASVHAVMNGQHVTLWCQAGFRKCASLAPGTYTVEADGDKAVRIYVHSLVSGKLMGKMKYRVAGTW